MNIFFTADTHFCHANIIKYSNRPWKSPKDFDENNDWINKNIARQRANEMDDALIDNWNSVVKRGDRVYHLGDILFGRVESDLSLIRRLNGNITLIKGNHDKISDEYPIYYNEYHPSGLLERYIDGQLIVMCHYAMRVWNKSHHGAFHLYGHSHGSLPDDPNSLSFDVGVDCHNYYPISIDTVKKIMSKKTYKPVDHHRND